MSSPDSTALGRSGPRLHFTITPSESAFSSASPQANLNHRLVWLSFHVHKPPSSPFPSFASSVGPHRCNIDWCTRRSAHDWINPPKADGYFAVGQRPSAATLSGKRFQLRFQLWSQPYSVWALLIRGQAVAFWTAPIRVTATVTSYRRQQ